MLSWSTNNLTQYQEKPLTFAEKLDLRKDLMARDEGIVDLAPVEVSGNVLYSRGDFTVTMKLMTTVTLPSTRSLKPVAVPIKVSFVETYLTDPGHAELYDEDELLMPLTDGYLDLLPAIEDNVLLALPIQVLSAEEKSATELPQGDGWGLLTEDQYQAQKKAEKSQNSPFAGLEGLFDQDNDDTNKK